VATPVAPAPVAAPAAAAPAAVAKTATTEDMKDALLRVVSDRTGYPV